MHTFLSSLLLSWRNQRDYIQRLIADLSDQDMVFQPIPGVMLNHPAWTLGHLTPYPTVLAAILMQQPFEDPIHSKYARGTKPLSDSTGYPPKAQLLADF